MRCQKAFRSLGGEGAHMHRTHGEVHPVRHLMGSTQCAACLTEYFTMGKLKMHLIRSTACRITLIGRGNHEPAQPGLGSTEDTERWSRWDNGYHRWQPLDLDYQMSPEVTLTPSTASSMRRLSWAFWTLTRMISKPLHGVASRNILFHGLDAV